MFSDVCLCAGKARAGADVVLFVSHSGNTEECYTAARQLTDRTITTLSLTSGGGKIEQFI